MVEAYLLAKETVLKKYEEDDCHYPLFVVSLYSFFIKYPELKNTIIDIFLTTQIVIENSSINDILDKYNISVHSMDDDGEYGKTYAISSNGAYFILNENKYELNSSGSFIACSYENEEILLNTFIHEFNHLIKSSFDFYRLGNTSDTSQFTLRNGINYYKNIWDIKTGKILMVDYYDTFDEVINTLQTTELISNIFVLEDIVFDNKVTSYLKSLDRDILSDDYGYEACVDVIKPLWENPSFKSLIEDNILIGDLDVIIPEFDSILDKGSFSILGDLLDDINDLYCQNPKDKLLKMKIKEAKKMVFEYNKRTKFVYTK